MVFNSLESHNRPEVTVYRNDVYEDTKEHSHM